MQNCRLCIWNSENQGDSVKIHCYSYKIAPLNEISWDFCRGNSECSLFQIYSVRTTSGQYSGWCNYFSVRLSNCTCVVTRWVSRRAFIWHLCKTRSRVPWVQSDNPKRSFLRTFAAHVCHWNVSKQSQVIRRRWCGQRSIPNSKSSRQTGCLVWNERMKETCKERRVSQFKCDFLTLKIKAWVPGLNNAAYAAYTTLHPKRRGIFAKKDAKRTQLA